MPINPIPTNGSIQITWPEKVEIPANTQCKVMTNRLWENVCTLDEINRTINILNVFSETTTFNSEVTITLVGVINPQNNKERGSGFTIRTYADNSQIYWIDQLLSDILVPVLDCTYPCRGCLESDKLYC